MSATDSVTVLAELGRPATPRTEFADALLESCLAELGAPVRRWPADHGARHLGLDGQVRAGPTRSCDGSSHSVLSRLG